MRRQIAAGGRQMAGQFGHRAHVTEGQAEQCLLLIGPSQQCRAGPGHDLACRPYGSPPGQTRLDGRFQLADHPVTE